MLGKNLAILLSICLLAALPIPPATGVEAPRVTLSGEGKAMFPITVSPRATREVRSVAEDLAKALKRITGADFAIQETADAAGIVIGTADDWPDRLPPLEAGFPLSYAKEDYVIRTAENGLFLVGRTSLGVRNAVWDFLFRIGFRQFFPGEHWEVWPSERNLAVQFDRFERPSYYSRNLSFSTALGKGFTDWKVRNRMESGFLLRAYHMYGGLIRRNPDHFKQYPEDVVSAEKDVKLDPSRQTVLEVAVNDSIRVLERNPDWESISMEPSDGGNWRVDSPLGSPSNQAVTLANHVARSLREAMPERDIKVGLLAYHLHSPPPEIEVDRNVVVRVATAYIQGGHTPEELLKGWHEKGASTGVSEFLSIWSWDFGLPGRSRAADLDYLSRTIPAFYRLGARHWNAQATASWGCDGLGYYLASRLLWDVSEAGDVEAILDDFYKKAFGDAAGEMRELYETCLLKKGNILFSGDLIGRMYRLLDAALQKAKDQPQTLRILDIALYTRYLDLVLQCLTSSGAEREESLTALSRFVSDHRDATALNMALPLKRSPIPGMKLRKSESPPVPLTAAELRAVIKDGGIRHPKLGFSPVGYSSDLVPYPEDAPDGEGSEVTLIGGNRLTLHAGTKPGEFRFSVTGGRLYQTKGPVRMRLFAEENPVLHEPVAVGEVPADRHAHELLLSSPYGGLHRLEIADGGGGTGLSWPVGQRVVIPVAPGEKAQFVSSFRHSLAFHVPRGTAVVGGYSAKPIGKLLAPDGTVALDFTTMNGPGYFSVPVPAGADGKLWSFQNASGEKLLLTVPPWLARNAGELLVPAEVAHADSTRSSR